MSRRSRRMLQQWQLTLPVAGLALMIVGASALAQEQVPANAAYLNPRLPVEQRVNDLISRMTLAEKVSQMRDMAAAIPRLNVPTYGWWSEAAHGVAAAGYATNFPQVIGLAATWDAPLMHQIGEVASTEGRAKYHETIRQGRPERFYGLTFWAPNINIFRDPRWGRGQETYGEDPFLTARLATAFVKGMQGDDPKYLKVVSTPKHYAVHSGPEPLRHRFDVDVSPFDLADTYMPAFRATIVEGGAQSVMCAYNAIDGAPACANEPLLKEWLRGYWGFTGYVVSDCGAITDITSPHGYTPDQVRGAVVSVKAGTDLECGGPSYGRLTEAVQQGLITEAELDTSLKRLFTARFRLGMFDPPESYAYGRIPFSEVNSPAHRALALRAAREAMVLLKNDGVLPLAASGKRIAVLGPTAELVQAQEGNYQATPRDPVSPIAGIEKLFGAANVVTAQGSLLAEGMSNPIPRSALRSGTAAGLKGEYFATPDLTGQPVAVRVDPSINFDWRRAEQMVRGLERNNWSVRWTGTFTPPAAGDYRLGARVGGGFRSQNRETVRIYLDGQLVLDNSQLQGRAASAPDTLVRFADAKPREIRVEYQHYTGEAGIDVTWQPPAGVLLAEATAAARQADVVVALMGLSTRLEGEEMPVTIPGFQGGDRTDIGLPAPQRELLAALKATGKPVVLVLTSGSALAVDEQQANAIIQAWYAGEEGGTAIAETLSGANNPAGRLPLTFFTSVDQLPPFEEYSMKGRTYRYFTGKPWRGFGYGLSYSKFGYGGLKLPAQVVTAGDPVVVEVDVKNESQRAGDEVVELYLTQPRQALTPLRTLAGFERIHLAPGETRHVRLTIDPRTIGQVTEQGERVVVPGTYQVFVGGTQPGESAGGVSGKFTVNGPAKTLPR